MRFARLRGADGSLRFARLEGSLAHVIDGAPWLVSRGASEPATSYPYREADLACPVAPTKIICVGRNYAAHAKELGHPLPAEPLLFMKPPSSLLGPGEEILLPAASARVEHEAELGVVVGARARNVSPARAVDHVFGYTCVCDVTARDLQTTDGQWTRAKGFDTFCPVGPFIETELDPIGARIVCRVNGQVRQDGSTSQMIFDVPTLLSYASHVMTLEPGDLLVTGTPEGVGLLVAGDAVEVSIQSADGQVSLGTLRERVALERPAC
jgi:2-keto-4-pentenoate hydratase/2-oxohepta-3-ene-1,7-dioic acid hydratase in catechol pathway